MNYLIKEHTEDWVKTIDVKADRVIDIGGAQEPIKGRTKSWDVNKYMILDLKEPHQCKQKPDIIWDLNKQLKQSGEYDRFDKPYLKQMGGMCEMEKSEERYFIYDKFDVAFCLGVSEYWWNPYTALYNISEFLLKYGGILYITFHFIYAVHSPVQQDYLRYTPRGMEKLLNMRGFKILEMRPKIDKEKHFYKAMIQNKMKIAREGYDRHHWISCDIKAVKT